LQLSLGWHSWWRRIWLKAMNSTLVSINRPETELLVTCALVCEEPEREARIRALLQKGIDWTYLLWAARRHGMIPLLYRHLDATCPEAVPRATMDQLRNHFQENARHNVMSTGQLIKLLDLFGAHEVPVIPYKGPTLAAFAYGNLALREFIDLDVLVRKQDVPRANELLISLGYRRYDPEGDSVQELTRAQEDALLYFWKEYNYVHPDLGIMVELHWAIIERDYALRLDPEELWGRLKQISLGGRPVLTLSQEDLLLILCIHGCHHLWERLSWICDVAQLIHRHNEEIDWQQLIEQARRLGSERMLFLGLFLASDLLGATLPKEVLQRVEADPVVKALAKQMRGWLFREPGRPLPLFEDKIFQLRLRERQQDKILLGFHMVMTPSIADLTLLSLPRALFPLYYMLRPIRMIRTLGWRLLERFT